MFTREAAWKTDGGSSVLQTAEGIERKAVWQLVIEQWSLFLMDSVTHFLQFGFKLHCSKMHCSKKLERKPQILVSQHTSFVTIKEQRQPNSAGRLFPGPVNLSEIEELKLKIMT